MSNTQTQTQRKYNQNQSQSQRKQNENLNLNLNLNSININHANLNLNSTNFNNNKNTNKRQQPYRKTHAPMNNKNEIQTANNNRNLANANLNLAQKRYHKQNRGAVYQHYPDPNASSMTGISNGENRRFQIQNPNPNSNPNLNLNSQEIQNQIKIQNQTQTQNQNQKANSYNSVQHRIGIVNHTNAMANAHSPLHNQNGYRTPNPNSSNHHLNLTDPKLNGITTSMSTLKLESNVKGPPPGLYAHTEYRGQYHPNQTKNSERNPNWRNKVPNKNGNHLSSTSPPSSYRKAKMKLVPVIKTNTRRFERVPDKNKKYTTASAIVHSKSSSNLHSNSGPTAPTTGGNETENKNLTGSYTNTMMKHDQDPPNMSITGQVLTNATTKSEDNSFILHSTRSPLINKDSPHFSTSSNPKETDDNIMDGSAELYAAVYAQTGNKPDFALTVIQHCLNKKKNESNVNLNPKSTVKHEEGAPQYSADWLLAVANNYKEIEQHSNLPTTVTFEHSMQEARRKYDEYTRSHGVSRFARNPTNVSPQTITLDSGNSNVNVVNTDWRKMNGNGNLKEESNSSSTELAIGLQMGDIFSKLDKDILSSRSQDEANVNPKTNGNVNGTANAKSLGNNQKLQSHTHSSNSDPNSNGYPNAIIELNQQQVAQDELGEEIEEEYQVHHLTPELKPNPEEIRESDGTPEWMKDTDNNQLKNCDFQFAILDKQRDKMHFKQHGVLPSQTAVISQLEYERRTAAKNEQAKKPSPKSKPKNEVVIVTSEGPEYIEYDKQVALQQLKQHQLKQHQSQLKANNHNTAAPEPGSETPQVHEISRGPLNEKVQAIQVAQQQPQRVGEDNAYAEYIGMNVTKSQNKNLIVNANAQVKNGDDTQTQSMAVRSYEHYPAKIRETMRRLEEDILKITKYISQVKNLDPQEMAKYKKHLSKLTVRKQQYLDWCKSQMRSAVPHRDVQYNLGAMNQQVNVNLNANNSRQTRSALALKNAASLEQVDHFEKYYRKQLHKMQQQAQTDAKYQNYVEYYNRKLKTVEKRRWELQKMNQLRKQGAAILENEGREAYRHFMQTRIAQQQHYLQKQMSQNQNANHVQNVPNPVVVTTEGQPQVNRNVHGFQQSPTGTTILNVMDHLNAKLKNVSLEQDQNQNHNQKQNANSQAAKANQNALINMAITDLTPMHGQNAFFDLPPGYTKVEQQNLQPQAAPHQVQAANQNQLAMQSPNPNQAQAVQPSMDDYIGYIGIPHSNSMNDFNVEQSANFSPYRNHLQMQPQMAPMGSGDAVDPAHAAHLAMLKQKRREHKLKNYIRRHALKYVTPPPPMDETEQYHIWYQNLKKVERIILEKYMRKMQKANTAKRRMQGQQMEQNMAQPIVTPQSTRANYNSPPGSPIARIVNVHAQMAQAQAQAQQQARARSRSPSSKWPQHQLAQAQAQAHAQAQAQASQSLRMPNSPHAAHPHSRVPTSPIAPIRMHNLNIHIPNNNANSVFLPQSPQNAIMRNVNSLNQQQGANRNIPHMQMPNMSPQSQLYYAQSPSNHAMVTPVLQSRAYYTHHNLSLSPRNANPNTGYTTHYPNSSNYTAQ